MFGKLVIFVFMVCINGASWLCAQAAPSWVANKEGTFPDRDWLCVVESARNRQEAQSAAMNALARTFKTDVQSITAAAQQVSQVINDTGGDTGGRKIASFNESRDFAQEVVTSTNVTGLIGVQSDVWESADGRVYANARMNRRQCATRYTAMIHENLAVIRALQEDAVRTMGTFDAYEALNFAVNLALITDNFQSILTVLDPASSGRSFEYGNADAVKALAQNAARSILIVVQVEGDVNNRINRAFASFFTTRGFRAGSSGTGSYQLSAVLELEDIDLPNQRNKFSRYLLNVSVEDQEGREVFSYSGNGRQGHVTQSEARQRAIRAAETSIGEAEFAEDFDRYLLSLLK
jgi:hypothetical protein